ncbi:MAG: 2-hydroxyacyl-CoA dehydratase [Oscillospiraceae bacterium]|nr:2-hydroxyacyl-CoA dehydratase [Oscillospiraceae bacterium]
MKEYRAGIDIGSTTVKLIVLDGHNCIIYGNYKRHHAKTQETLAELLKEAQRKLGECGFHVRITGSGSIHLGKALHIAFVQEVTAVARALQQIAPQTDVAIELGGEDAKIIYFSNGIEERMNGVCAGGTGAFIDQMAALLQTDAAGLNKAAEDYRQIYPIAARCGVFAKTDIQPLINEGASKSDLAASIFQAVVNQTISGLACGKPIRGRVAFLGGPLHYLPELRKAFIRTLKLTPETTVELPDSHLFAAIGAALDSEEDQVVMISMLIQQLEKGVQAVFEMPRLPALFQSAEEYHAFCKRHGNAVVPKEELSSYQGKCYLGIDAGSTTTKIALIGEEGQLLYSSYSNNQGNPIEAARAAMCELHKQLPSSAIISRSCSTGYGEALLKTAFSLDEGEVETIAHSTAAAFFDKEVDCVLDIGGQDMKCITLRNGAVDQIMLNEACSSGCGSFIENFANSLGYTAEQFAEEALFAEHPVDLGTRCTVFMNSNVKQAQKEGASVADISAGLAYSVIKNALYKVIKLTNIEELGTHIVVQGGTFHNQAVLRALEKITGAEVTCPDISGIMGAFGAALIARSHDCSQKTSLLSAEEISDFTYASAIRRCTGCSNHCMLTVNTFSNGKKHISGNRCEKGIRTTSAEKDEKNMVAFKRRRLFDYPILAETEAYRGTIGIPRVLNLYENYPFWAVFFRKLGFRIVLSPFSDRSIYEMGMESIPSESVCYPAKLSHGHVQWLIHNGMHTIFYPCVFYEHQETPDAQNHYNCPIVISYPENIKNNVEQIADGSVKLIRPFISFANEKTAADRLVKLCRKEWNIPEKEVRSAVAAAWQEQQKAKTDIRSEGRRLLLDMEKHGRNGIVLAGRPYHMDPEICHGIPELITSYGLYVFTEDSLPIDFNPTRPLRVVDQWVYHSRLYSAAEFVCQRNDLELIQLNSFGCGIDAVTTDQVKEIMDQAGKLYTLLKIDETANLGAIRIRIRSLLSAMRLREEQKRQSVMPFQRAEFTKAMRDAEYTILAPQMSPIHFDILESVFKKHHYQVVVLDNDTRSAIDTGLKYVNNDACYPSITVVGQIMDAILSGKYDTDRLAVMMTQTGGCCRASNYIALIRRALKKAGLSHIPVISLNANGMERNEGFSFTPSLLKDAAHALIYGDLLMRCLYRVRPYEQEKGTADALHHKWKSICIDSLTNPHTVYSYRSVCRSIVAAFDALPIDETLNKPRVGVVGEILVKYMPLANNHIVELLEHEGAEAVVPDMLDFFNFIILDSQYKTKYLGKKKSSAVISKGVIELIRQIRKPAVDALKASQRFDAPISIYQVAEMTKPFLSLGNQYGEGWFLTGEMVELITHGTPNIVCIQPFACLPNHVVGKGTIKALKHAYPEANIAAIDYDPGASEVNQLNRIKLMLSVAKERCKKRT